MDPSGDAKPEQKYLDAANRAVQYFLANLSEEGQLRGEDVEQDPAFYYKLPALLFLSGRDKEANAVLSYIEKSFITADGDVRKSADVKTRNGALCMYSVYINGWIAKAAVLAKKNELYEKLKAFSASCQPEPMTGWLNTPGGQFDFLTTAHFGTLALLNKEMPIARPAADFLTNAVSKQPLTDAFYTRMEQDGSPITSYPQDIEAFCAIKSSAPNQLYFFVGYPAAFLASAYQETKDDRYLAQAKRLLDFSLQCDESIYKFFFAHKVAWAASIVAAITKDRKYADLATRIADHLLSLHSESGLFLVEGDPMDKYDQSAEIAQWLTEIAKNLGKIP